MGTVAPPPELATAAGEDASGRSPGTDRAVRLLPVLGMALVAFLLSLAVRQALMPLGTGNADEGIYTYQAHLLQEGEVTVPAESHDPFFRPWLTGSRDGELFFQYEPAWPAVLAVSDSVFGSMEVGVALCFAGLVVGVYGLAMEALRSRRTALVAAAFTVLTPMFVWQSAMRLAYLFTALLATIALALAFRAARTAHGWLWVTTGGLLGGLLLTRPFDGAITAGAVGLIGLFVDRRGPLTGRWRDGLLVVAGGVPFLLIALAYNAATTGSWRTFPLMASDPMNRFGFGDRRMQVGADVIDYSSDVAFESLWTNLWGSLGWMFGGPLAVVLGAVALGFERRRPARLVLLAFLVAFPLGYLFWWATALAAQDVTNGIGPHYYVPAFVPLVILSADGLAWLSRRQLAAAAVAVPAMLAATIYQLPDKVHLARSLSDYFEVVDSVVAQAPHDSIVVLRAPKPAGFVIVQYPFLLNDPDLDDDVLYAVDLRARDAQLIAARPDRRVLLLHQEVRVGDDFFDPGWTLTEVWASDEPEIAVQLEPPEGTERLTLFARSSVGDEERGPLGDVDEIGEVVFELDPACDRPSLRRLCLVPGENEVVVGLDSADGQRWQRRYDVLVDDAGVHVVHPGIGQQLVDFGAGPVLVNRNVDDVIRDAGRP